MASRNQFVWRALPLAVVAAVVVLSLSLRNPDGRQEYYPFSNYPMYSQFDEVDYFVYIADQHGEPLPSKDTFRITTPKIKKRFKAELKAAKKRLGLKRDSDVAGDALREVARATLATLDKPVAAHPRVARLEQLQLVRVDLRRDGRRIAMTEEVVASIPFRPPTR